MAGVEAGVTDSASREVVERITEAVGDVALTLAFIASSPKAAGQIIDAHCDGQCWGIIVTRGQDANGTFTDIEPIFPKSKK